MTGEAVKRALRDHPFVEEFPNSHLERLAGMAREVSFERDQVIFHEGDECGEFYLITGGRVALEITAPGRTFRVQTLDEGDELGWSAVMMRSGKYFQARALEPVTALAIDGGALLEG